MCFKNYKQYFKTFNENKCYELLVYFKIDKQSQISNLSKGDNEKLQLALCLSIEASLYILDEPLVTVGLLTRIEIIKMILNNFDLKTSIIFSSHLVRDIDTILDIKKYFAYQTHGILTFLDCQIKN